MSMKMKRRIRIVMLIFIALWMFVIFSFSADTGIESHTLSDICVTIFNKVIYRFTGKDLRIAISAEHYMWIELCFRKLAHMFIYFVLAISVMLFLYTFKLNMFVRIVMSLFYCFVYALSDEFHQLFVDGRGASFFDALIDTTGAMLGIIVALILYCIAYTLYYKVKHNKYPRNAKHLSQS